MFTVQKGMTGYQGINYMGAELKNYYEFLQILAKTKYITIIKHSHHNSTRQSLTISKNYL